MLELGMFLMCLELISKWKATWLADGLAKLFNLIVRLLWLEDSLVGHQLVLRSHAQSNRSWMKPPIIDQWRAHARVLWLVSWYEAGQFAGLVPYTLHWFIHGDSLVSSSLGCTKQMLSKSIRACWEELCKTDSISCVLCGSSQRLVVKQQSFLTHSVPFAPRPARHFLLIFKQWRQFIRALCWSLPRNNLI